MISLVKLFIKDILFLLFHRKSELEKEQERLIHFPRYTETITSFLDKPFKLVDAASFLFIRTELFEQHIYQFKANTLQPYILDCGANIGLGIIYFKQLYPQAEIVGFEPDKKVFDVLRYNVSSLGLDNVTLVDRGLWNEETTLRFFSEGADGGRVAQASDEENIKEIRTTRLRDFLHKPVDFLKIDIEGAEMVVLEDCKDLLHYVKHLFVEYHSFENTPQHLSTLIAILENAGFRLYVSSPGLTSPQPFVNITIYQKMDMQLNIYAFRH